jgi:hypothetical protein
VTPTRAKKPTRRRHPATATRWLLGGLSVASFLAIAGTVTAANQTNVSNGAIVSPVAATPESSTSATPTTSASANHRSTPVPAAHTVTRGS